MAADLGARCEALRVDISKAEDRRKLVELTKSKFGRCHMLVNNAGVAPTKRLRPAGGHGGELRPGPEHQSERALLPDTDGRQLDDRAEEGGPTGPYRIVNTSSISAYTSSPARGEYCISKAGISMMTALYADRLAEFEIGVFEVRPGIIKTDMTKVVTEKYDKMIAAGLTPIQRWGFPEDVGRAVGAIAEGRLDFCTGQVINVDGGFHLRRL